MEDLSAFLAMNGYADFIWPVYGVALALCGVIWILRAKSLRALEHSLKGEDQSS